MYYLDEMMPRTLAEEVIARGYQVVMAIDVEMEGKDDSDHLRYASQHNLILVTRDKPFAGRTMKDINHSGLICWTGAQQDVGGMVRALVEFAGKYEPDEVKGRVFWLR